MNTSTNPGTFVQHLKFYFQRGKSCFRAKNTCSIFPTPQGRNVCSARYEWLTSSVEYVFMFGCKRHCPVDHKYIHVFPGHLQSVHTRFCYVAMHSTRCWISRHVVCSQVECILWDPEINAEASLQCCMHGQHSNYHLNPPFFQRKFSYSSEK